MAINRTARKLYFNFAISPSAGSNTTRQIFPCTQITVGTPGDRNGSLLQVVTGLTGGAPSAVRQRNEVMAVAMISNGGTTSATRAQAVEVDFIGPTSGASTAAITPLPFLIAGGGGLTANATFAGTSAIFSITAGQPRHFSVRVRKAGGPTSTHVYGMLMVEKQHSIEV